MEKMEHMDPQRAATASGSGYRRSWTGPGGAGRLSGSHRENQGGRENIPERTAAAVPAAPEIPAEPAAAVLPCRQGHGQHPAHSGLHRG